MGPHREWRVDSRESAEPATIEAVETGWGNRGGAAGLDLHQASHSRNGSHTDGYCPSRRHAAFSARPHFERARARRNPALCVCTRDGKHCPGGLRWPRRQSGRLSRLPLPAGTERAPESICGRSGNDGERLAMCGIAGIVSSDRTERVEEITVHRMCQAITHRGPDDEGVLAKQNTGLGMRRLSIIDVAGGHQPVFNEDRSIWTVFNGEIYNFPELRPELIARGHRFYTNTDTEVIVHLYEEMGAECVQKLRGMFAFALWDDRRGCLLVARDRLGKKPLHYALHKGKLYFASEIKSILSVAPELAEVNRAALMQYMYLGYVPDPATAFSNIHKLPPGHLLEFQRGEVRVRKYWDLPEYGTHKPMSEEECLEEMEARLAEATRIRLISDVPLGALLSGGTDSSTIVALMARASSKPVKTFSIGSRNSDFDESKYARVVAQKFATEHHELVLDPDVVASLEKLTSSLGEPFSDPSILPTYFVSCLARRS